MTSSGEAVDLERLLSTLLIDARRAGQHEFGDLVNRHARELLGATDTTIYLVELAQRNLTPLPRGGTIGEPLDIEGTIAGRVYRNGETVVTSLDGHTRVWVPLLDGRDRLGVLGLTFHVVDDPTRRAVEILAALIAELIVSMNQYGDLFQLIRRRAQPSLAAELQWTMLPPLTCQVGGTKVSGILEPAYDIGGDSFDYSFDDGVAHLAVFDAMGHGLDAAMAASLAVAGYRHARRDKVRLELMYRAIDAALSSEYKGEKFVTAHLARLDSSRGRLAWLNAGHPPPLLVRAGRVVGELECEPTLPFGLGGDVVEVADVQLEPGDRVFFFTDGVVEARSPTAGFFGHDRLVDFLEREAASEESAPEVLRRLARAILAHQGGELQDDATILFLEWHPSDPPPAA